MLGGCRRDLVLCLLLFLDMMSNAVASLSLTLNLKMSDIVVATLVLLNKLNILNIVFNEISWLLEAITEFFIFYFYFF